MPKRSPRNHVYICDLGYSHGITRLSPRPATTPQCEPHTPQPGSPAETPRNGSVWCDAATPCQLMGHLARLMHAESKLQK